MDDDLALRWLQHDMLSDRPANDDIDPAQRPNIPGYINQMTGTPGKPDEDYTHLREKKLLNADDVLHDQIQIDPSVDTQTELQQLIPKMSSGVANKQERMRFYDLTGTGV